MRLARLLSIPMLLALSSVAAAAVDLAKIERTIAREPAYRGKPKYCLLMFGPEAKTRVWLVQDGATLYVDRNGNGDLTEPGEKIAAEKREGADEGTYSFEVGEIRDGARRHKEMHVYVSKIDHLADQEECVKALLAKDPKARGYRVLVEVEMPDRKGAAPGGRVQQRTSATDVDGVLQFAERPQDAPVLHFGGPWQVTLFGAHQLKIGRETDVVLGVGSPGVGPGSTTWIDYENAIPEKVYPMLEVVYPPKRSGDPPLREHYDLKHRC
jgi:hypothetical protein